MADFARHYRRQGDRLCHGCESKGYCQHGLDLLEFDDPSGEMRVHVACPAHHAGGLRIAHGGWVCTIMDEVIGQRVIEAYGQVVTMTLTVDFKKPVSVEVPLEVTARIERVEDGRKIWASGEIRMVGQTDILAIGRGLFLTPRVDHYTKHHAWVSAVTGAGSVEGAP